MTAAWRCNVLLKLASKRLAEVGLQLLVGVTEERGIATIHRQVGEVVEGREDGELGKTRHAGHHHEADVADVVLDLAVKGGEFGADGLGLGDVVQRVTNRRVVLVNEDNHGLAALPGKKADGIGKVVIWGQRRIIDDFDIFEGLFHACHQPCIETLNGLHVHRAEVEVENGVRFPVVVHLVDGEALEEVTAALEEILQRREHERLTEAPRTGDEEEGVPPTRDERIEQCGLVHITESILPHNAEVIGSLRDFLFFHAELLAYSIA